LNSTSDYDFDLIIVIGMTFFCIDIPNFIKIGQQTADLSLFSRWWPAAMLDFVWVLLDHHEVQLWIPTWSTDFESIGFIVSDGDIAILRYWRFALKLPHVVISASQCACAESRANFFPDGNHPHIGLFCIELSQ